VKTKLSDSLVPTKHRANIAHEPNITTSTANQAATTTQVEEKPKAQQGFTKASEQLSEAQKERKAAQSKVEASVGTAGVFALGNIAAGLDALADFEPGKVSFGGVGGAKREDLTDQMFGVVSASQNLADAVSALKADPSSTAARSRFEEAAKSLDEAQHTMLDAIKRQPAGERRIVTLDTCDAAEVGHGKPAATTKLGYAVETLTKGKFGDALKKALHLDDAGFAKARDIALRASEWTTLGDLTIASKTLAQPSAPSGEERAQIAKLPQASAQLAQELGLVDQQTADALAGHMEFKGRDSSPASQILGAVRMLASLSEPRMFRDKALLSVNDIHDALMQNAKAPQPKIDAALVSMLQPVLSDAVAALRS
jgi:hypothetical protein